MITTFFIGDVPCPVGGRVYGEMLSQTHSLNHFPWSGVTYQCKSLWIGVVGEHQTARLMELDEQGAPLPLSPKGLFISLKSPPSLSTQEQNTSWKVEFTRYQTARTDTVLVILTGLRKSKAANLLNNNCAAVYLP